MAKGKITIKENGEHSGKSFLSSFKFLPALAPTLALILVSVLPEYLSSQDGAFTEKLVQSSIEFCCLFMIMVLGGLSIMIFRDRSAVSRSMKAFRFRPAEPVSEVEDLEQIRIDEK